MQDTTPLSHAGAGALETNKVLRNTYSMLAMTLLFAAATAMLSMALSMPPMTYLISVGAAFLIMFFVLPRTQDSAAGIVTVFAFTGLMGFALGPMLSMYLALPNGSSIVATAMGGTGAIFLALSAYVLTTKKDFSFMGGFLFVGLLVVIGAALANIFFSSPMASIGISSAIILLMSGFILFDTSRIINGGETNYLRATVSLFMNIFNLFTSLLHLLGIMSDD